MIYFDTEPVVRMPSRLRELLKRGELPRASQEDLEARRAMELIDPGYSLEAGLSTITRNLISEIRGIPKHRGYYWKNFYGKPLSGSQKVSIARAMVLADELKGRHSGRLDELTLDSFGRIFEAFGADGPLKFISPHSLDQEPREYSHLLRKLLSDYLEPRPIWEQKVNGLLGRRRIYLVLGHGASGELSWRTRGASNFVKQDRQLVEDLNRVLADYHDRLQLKSDYLKSKPLPGLDFWSLDAAEEMLTNYYSPNFDSSILSPGISFGDDFIQLEASSSKSKARAYIARCVDCSHPAMAQVFYLYDRQTASWQNPADSFSVGQPDHALSRILFSAHGKTGCPGTSARSSKTGDLISIHYAY